MKNSKWWCDGFGLLLYLCIVLPFFTVWNRNIRTVYGFNAKINMLPKKENVYRNCIYIKLKRVRVESSPYGTFEAWSGDQMSVIGTGDLFLNFYKNSI